MSFEELVQWYARQTMRCHKCMKLSDEPLVKIEPPFIGDCHFYWCQACVDSYRTPTPSDGGGR